LQDVSTANNKDELRLSAVGVSVEGQVGLLSLGRPAASNAMDFELLEDLAKAVSWCSAPGRLQALVVTGSGRDFSVGGDLETLQRGVGDGSAADRSPGRLAAELGKTILAIQAMRCPVIAAINGRAGGGGFSLALACDLRVASERSVLDFAYQRIGATPDGGMTWFLPAIVGPSRARELLLEAPIIRAQRALDERLVSRVVPKDELVDAALEMARRLADQPPHYLEAVKQLCDVSRQGTLAGHLAEEQRRLEASLRSGPGRQLLLEDGDEVSV
jgi:2-(1,2-epoxy-1,2-dihydrophenyl)acetyl-CoA isomerase